MNEARIKIRVQTRIVIISVILLVGKFIAFALTNSVGILTDALESIVNVVAGLISLYSIRVASKPRDANHPFGHGKVEMISASIEGLLITGAGAFIIYEGAKRLLAPPEIQSLDIGIIIIAAAGLINYLLGWYSIRTGRKYKSVALISGGKHLQSDTYSSVGLVVGLVLLFVTGIGWIDSALAFIFGGIIIFTGISILRKTISSLVDEADEETLEEILKTVNRQRRDDWVDIHNMKSINYGNSMFVTCDLTLPWYYTLRESHDDAEALRKMIEAEFSGQLTISIHTDPCVPSTQCRCCMFYECTRREHPFESSHEFTLKDIVESDEDRSGI